MAENTAISWCHHTWSPVWGCTQISKAETGGGGCDNCYAMTLAHRFGYGWNGAPTRVFPSMCDPFDKDWPDGVRDRFWQLIAATPALDWLLLTKRIGNARSMMPAHFGGQGFSNVWLGATVVNQEEADRDIPKLLATPALVRFLSIEPMLGPVDLTGHLGPFMYPSGAVTGIDWVIAGGESGAKARPLTVQWLHALVKQCRAAGVACHVKQLGHIVRDYGMASPGQHWPKGIVRQNRPRFTEEDPGFFVELKHVKGGDTAEWPEALRVQEFPSHA
jgi:protein gp37